MIFFILSLALFGAGLYLFTQSPQVVTIESEESKNKNQQAVFNKIKWIPGENQDVWMMNQSHEGAKASPEKWERLAIVIDKTVSPKTARYYQLNPGPLAWQEDLLNQRTSYRVSCYICHNNGPRVLRPVMNSERAKLGWLEKIKISLWNLRIKTYGRIHSDPTHDVEDLHQKVPFRYHGKPHDDSLKVAVCMKCHNEEGGLARGELKRQQVGTIQHLVERGEMPPPGFALSKKDEQHLLDFIRGFE